MKKVIIIISVSLGLLFLYNQFQCKEKAKKPKVTFVELGSVRCIPCKKMQPVLKSLEEKYGKQLEIIFYDIWTEEGKPKGTEYKITAIPTQVFLDKNGKEFHRHVGFYPEEEIDSLLQKQSLKIIKK